MDPNEHRRQKNYRGLLRALSRPGRIVHLDGLDGMTSFPAVEAFAECLLDSAVGFCVIGSGRSQPLQTAIADATGARPDRLESADFIFFSEGGSRGNACLAKRGAPESPEDGATLVYCLESQPAAVCDRLRVRLAGPGIPGRDGIAPEMDGIPIEEFQALMAVNADYPLGVDAFFVRSGGEVMGLPRSTRILVR
jgi:alpha-D-ribose 1-methylphosphonate 5-triphosphate synthase subunit PhnH